MSRARGDLETLLRQVVLVGLGALGGAGVASSALGCVGPDGSSDAGADSGSRDAVAQDARGGDSPRDSARDVAEAPTLIELRVTAAAPADAAAPIELIPAFSPDIHDYYVRCVGDTNALRVSMTASPGAQSLLLRPRLSPSLPEQTISPLAVGVNEAIVAVASNGSGAVEYWVRCLPSDFPVIQWDAGSIAAKPAPGYYLVGSLYALVGYAMVLDAHGVPVWYYREPSGGVCDVDDVVHGAVSFVPTLGGPFQVHELSPLVETNVTPSRWQLDMHDLRVSPNGHYVAIASSLETGVDLTGIRPIPLPDGGRLSPGPGSTIDACNIVELDPKTFAVVWTWRALEHFDPAEVSVEPELTYAPGDAGGARALVVDPFHCNSVDVDPENGNLLVSARQMNSVFYVERASGKVLWKMGGARESLDDATYVPVASPFNGQHDARLRPGWSTCAGGQVSMFDDETYADGGAARAVSYDVSLGRGDGGCDGGTAGARVAWMYEGDAASSAAGSFRIVGESRVIGWGLQSDRVFTEVDEKGNVLLDVRFTSFNASYRAIKAPLAAFDPSVMRATAGLP